MAEKYILSAAIGGVFVLLGRIVFDWLRGSRNGINGGSKKRILKELLESNKEIKELLRAMLVISNWMKDAHNKTDENGLFRWYVPKALITLARDNHDKILLMGENVKEFKKTIKRIDRRMDNRRKEFENDED